MEKTNIDSSQLSKLRRVVEETILYLIQEKKLSYHSAWSPLHTESCWAFLKLRDLWVAKLKREAQNVKRNTVHSENVVTGLKTKKNFSHYRKRRKGRMLVPYSKDSNDFKDYRIIEQEIDVDFWKRTIILLDDIIQGGIDGDISTR